MRAWWGLTALFLPHPRTQQRRSQKQPDHTRGPSAHQPEADSRPEVFPEPLCPPPPSCQGPERPQGQSALWRTGPSNGPQDPASSKGKISPKAVLDVLMLTWPWT